MDRQAFREQLNNALRETFLQSIRQFIDEEVESHQQLARYLVAVERRGSDHSESVFEQLSGIFNHLKKSVEQKEPDDFLSVYLSVVSKVAEDFPEIVEWQQSEDRFSASGDDSLIVSIGKKGKQSARGVSQAWHTAKSKTAALVGGSSKEWKPWKQIIPLQRLVTFHLLDREFVQGLNHELERMQLNVIMNLEQLLVEHKAKNEVINFADFATTLEQSLNSSKEHWMQGVVIGIEKIESEINEQVQRVDTIEHPKSYYREQRLAARRNSLEEQFHDHQQQWQSAQKMLMGRLQDVARFQSLSGNIDDEIDAFLESIGTQFREKLEDPFNELTQFLESAIETVGQGNIAENVRELKNKLGDRVENNLVTPIRQMLENTVLSREVEHFFESLLVVSNAVPQQAQLLIDEDIDSNPPKMQEKPMEWRLLVVRMMREKIMSGLQPQTQAYEQFLSGMLEEVREIDQIIEVNLESSLAAFEEHAEEEVEHPARIAREALKRILAKVLELEVQSKEKREHIVESVKEGRSQFDQALFSLLIEGDSKELQMLNAKYKVQEATKGWKVLMDSRFAEMQDRMMVWSRFGWRKSKDQIKTVQRFLGFKGQEFAEIQRADIASYLSETDQKIKELPYIYRRLFNFDAVADQRFYVPSLESNETFKRAYEQWQNSLPATFAIIGEKGSGKSTFLNLTLASQFEDEAPQILTIEGTVGSERQLVRFLGQELEISTAQNIEDLIKSIKEWKERRVLVLECMQNCFVRNINGYDAIEKLCYLISETKEQVFWMVSCSRYAWRFLDKTVQLSEYFSHITVSDDLEADEIKKVILNRHRSSGYSLYFEAGSDMLKARGYRKLQYDEERAQEFLQKNYFQKLTELAEGNASVAMIFWIRSIREFDDTYFYIKPLEITSVEMIEDLSPQVLFALAAFVMHDTLSAKDISLILHLTEQESRLLLNRLYSRGLLVQEDGIFAINHLMYRQIVRVLKERNIIHLL